MLGQGKETFFHTTERPDIDRENKLREIYQRWDARLANFSPDAPEHRSAIIQRDSEIAALWANQ